MSNANKNAIRNALKKHASNTGLVINNRWYNKAGYSNLRRHAGEILNRYNVSVPFSNTSRNIVKKLANVSNEKFRLIHGIRKSFRPALNKKIINHLQTLNKLSLSIIRELILRGSITEKQLLHSTPNSISKILKNYLNKPVFNNSYHKGAGYYN